MISYRVKIQAALAEVLKTKGWPGKRGGVQFLNDRRKNMLINEEAFLSNKMSTVKSL